MKLFWKIYIPVFISFILVAVAIFYTVSAQQISDIENNIVTANKMVAGFLVKEIQAGLLEGRIPFESLKDLSERQDFLFWWVARGDGEIYLADKASFIKTYAHDYFPDTVIMKEPSSIVLNDEKEYGIYVKAFEVGTKEWSFWLGFSLRNISAMRKRVILANMAIFAATLVLLGTILYIIVKHFTRPLRDLAVAAGIIGSGDLNHRARIESGDELGELALSFNTMAENLQKTTVSKAYVDNIVRTMKDPLIVVEPDKVISTVNEATCELLEFSEEELIGKPIDILSTGKEAGYSLNCGLDKLFKEGELTRYETKWKTKTGTEIPVLFAGSVMKDHQGKPICTVVTGKDISELKRVENELRKSQERFQLAARSATDLIYEWDMTGGRFEWFDDIDELLGHAPNQFPRTFQAWEHIIHPEDHDRVMASFQNHLSTGEPYDEEYRVLRTDSSVLYWKHCATLLRHEGDEACKWIGAVSNVTKRKIGEEALRASEASNRLLIEESPVGIAIAQDDKFAYVNPSLLGILGFERVDELVGESPMKFVVPEDRESIEKKEETGRAKDRTTYYYDVRCLSREGRLVDVSIWPKTIEYLGRPAILYFVIDTTEAKNLRSQLLQAQKMEALGTLSGGIAHDFNNMLTIILGYSELLLSDTGQAEPSYQDLQKVIQTAQKGAELVQRLLAFSKQTTINARPLNLNTEIEQFATLLARTIPKMVEIGLALSDDLPTIHADPVQIDQILVNLAINAKDAMPEGGKLVIETEHVSLDEEYCRKHLHRKAGEYVLLTVSDTGHGMDRDTVARIFDPFFTTKGRDSHKGTGLGLAVVKGIVEQHGGYISCYSEPALGTSFKIYFPAIKTADETERSKKDEPVDGTETILLVDDEKLVRDLGEKILKKAGYRVVSASNTNVRSKK